jgi:hypothetical protein
MAKDTRNIANAGAAKAGLKKISEKSDAAIAAQAKDSSNEAIQAGNAERMEGLPSSTSTPKDAPVAADPLRKPNIEPLDPTPGQDARAAAGNVGTGRVNRTTILDFGKLPSRPEGGSTPASVNVTDKPDVAINLADRMQSGMGLPGAEKGHLDHAVALHARDREIAMRTGKTVNGVQPNDPQATHITVFGGHHHRLAKVMHTFGIADEEVYANAASQSGQRLETYVHGLHKIAQEHEDSKRQITHTPAEGALWEHPSTKELIPVAANHPDMPMAFTRTKGKVARVTRDSQGKEVVSRSHEGWDSMKVAGGKTVYRQYTPEKGIDLVDHMRVQMLSEHGPSKTSRKRGGDIATDIANAVSGVVPRGMKQIGKRKVAVTETTGIVGETQSDGSRKYKKTSKTKEGTAPLLVPRVKRGSQAGEPPAPPKAKRNLMLVGKGEPKLTAEIPFFKDAPVKPGNIIDEASYKNPKRVNPNRGQQFAAIDTEGMTGAEEVRALRSKGALASQKNTSESKEVELRPGGKKQAKKDLGKTVQMSMFPSIKTPKESRKTSFYMDGQVQPISPASKALQEESGKRFGRKETSLAVEGGYAAKTDAKFEQPTGSRADKKNLKKLTEES